MSIGNRIIGSRTFRNKGVGLGSVYQKNQKNEPDPKGKLMIQNFDRDKFLKNIHQKHVSK